MRLHFEIVFWDLTVCAHFCYWENIRRHALDLNVQLRCLFLYKEAVMELSGVLKIGNFIYSGVAEQEANYQKSGFVSHHQNIRHAISLRGLRASLSNSQPVENNMSMMFFDNMENPITEEALVACVAYDTEVCI